MYPKTAGTRSAFFPIAAQPRHVILAAIGFVLAAAVGLCFLDPHGIWFTVALALAFFYTAAPLANLGDRRRPRNAPDVREMIERMLEVAGYQIKQSPVTGNGAVDPLLSQVDYLAVSNEHAFAVELNVSPHDGRKLDWSVASRLRTAAKALEDASHGGDIQVNPLLIVVGGRIDESLQEFSVEEGVKLVQFSRGELNDVMNLKEPTLRQRTLELLKIPPGRQMEPGVTPHPS
jgi:hypothetical protein